MTRSTLLCAPLLLAACATDGWNRMQEEFPEVSANCGLRGAAPERDPSDKRLLRLIFRQRNAAELQARANGSLGCVEHWARERGYRLTTQPTGDGD